MGKMVEVEIYETGKHFMKGRLADNSEIISPGLKDPLEKGVVSGVLDEVRLFFFFFFYRSYCFFLFTSSR